MPDIIKLKQTRAEVANKIRALSAEVEKRADHKMTAEEVTSFDQLRAQNDDLGKEIERADYIEKIAAGNTPKTESTVTVKRAESKWNCSGEYLQAVRTAQLSGRVDPRLVNEERTAADGATIGIPADGGFLVDTQTSDEVMKHFNEASVIASKCRHIQVGPNANGVKMKTIDETSRASGSHWGSVLGYWVREADSITGSKVKFGEWKSDLEKVCTMLYASDEMVQDAVQLGSIYKSAASEELAYKVDDAVIRGDGVGKPIGILNSSALVTVAKESGQSADTITYPNIVNMYSRMYAPSRSNAVWLINQDCEPQLFKMAFNDATTTAPAYMPANGLSGQPYSTLMGRPVIATEICSTLGDVGDILFVDLSQYAIIEKGGMQSAESIHVKFEEAQTAFRTTYRCNGQSLWSKAITPAHGTKTLSPFVALAAR